MPERALSDLVRGVVDEDALREIGVVFNASGGVARIESPMLDEVRPSVGDVASGYLQAWAQG